jgi:hypothetical protein
LVAFDPTRHAFFDNVVVLTVARAGQATCDLDTAVLQRSGGSFLVEQRASGSGNHYRTHWAGPRTSAGANDCGTDADLALTRLELNSLAVAAGGFGFDHGAIWNIR